MKRRLALWLHGVSYRLAPEIAHAERAVIITQLAEEHRQACERQAARLAEHRRRVAGIARNQ